MKIKSHNVVTPQQDMVVVRLLETTNSIEAPLSAVEGDMPIAVRYGEVVALGNDVLKPEHCAELQIGDIAIFTEFAGYYIATDDVELVKLIRGYDIVGKCKTMEDIENQEFIPTADRVLLEEYDIDAGLDIVLSTSARDPRLSDLAYGKIIKVGPSLQNTDLVDGMIVAYPPYVGTILREFEAEDKPLLRMVVELDVLMAVQTDNN